MDHEPRVGDGDGDGTAIVDMGADEYYDCNGNEVADYLDVAEGASLDCNGNGVPDECEGEVVPCGGLDIRPGSCPNPLNRSSPGILPVVLAGTECFDVTQIDVSTVRLSRADGVGGQVAPNEGPPGPHSTFEDLATPFEGGWCDCHELEGDGMVDLSVKFWVDAVVEILELEGVGNGDQVGLIITGTLLGGPVFTTTEDCILIVPLGAPHLMFGQNPTGTFDEVSRSGSGAGEEEPDLPLETVILIVESDAPEVFVGVSPPDVDTGASGFADFWRLYEPGTVITLAAQLEADDLSFYAWLVDGVMQNEGQAGIQVTIAEDMTVRALYRRAAAEPTIAGRLAPASRGP
jgi:hypothetical protein